MGEFDVNSGDFEADEISWDELQHMIASWYVSCLFSLLFHFNPFPLSFSFLPFPLITFIKFGIINCGSHTLTHTSQE